MGWQAASRLIAGKGMNDGPSKKKITLPTSTVSSALTRLLLFLCLQCLSHLPPLKSVFHPAARVTPNFRLSVILLYLKENKLRAHCKAYIKVHTL